MIKARLWRSQWTPLAALVGVAVLWVVFQRVSMELNFPLGYDESVYASQASTRPHMYWSAPRAYGLPMLLWPLVHATTSTVALRLYLSLLTALALVFAFAPWARLQRAAAVLGALIFSTLWVSTYYASLAMPNLSTALAVVAGVGYVARTLEHDRDRYRAGAVIALAVASLVRPSDATYVAVPLIIALILMQGVPRRIRTAAAVAVGLAIGWAFWTVEAFVNFGGPLKRIHDAGAQDGGGVYWNLPFYSHVISGPTACCATVHVLALSDLWWWALWPLAILGTWLARAVLRRAYVLCLVSAAGVFGQYLFLIKVQAPGPRTLLPVYALLVVPVASVLIFVARRWWGTFAGRVVLAALAVGLLGQIGLQQHVLRVNVAQQRPIEAGGRTVAEQLRGIGVTPPCALAGPDLPEVAYQAGCVELRGLPSAQMIASDKQRGINLAVLLWSEKSITALKPFYDRHYSTFTTTVLTRSRGRVSYVYRLSP